MAWLVNQVLGKSTSRPSLAKRRHFSGKIYYEVKKSLKASVIVVLTTVTTCK